MRSVLLRAPAPGAGVREEWRRVSEGLFEAAGMQIRAGRGFTPDDFRAMPSAVVVNAAFAAKHYPEADPVGRRLVLSNGRYGDMEIVGVVGNVLARGPALPAPPVIYAPYQGDPRGHVALYARVGGEPLDYAEAVRNAIWSVDGTQPVVQLQALHDVVRQATSVPRMIRELVTGLALIALLLAGVGVFGVVGYAVRTRRRELGVRLALGASTVRLERDISRQAVPMGILSIGAGLAVGGLAGRAADAVLYGVAALDPFSMLGAAGTMAVMAILAMYLPLRRVRGIDPIEVIRAE